MSRVLFVLTAANSIRLGDGSVHPTGFWAEEFVVTHRALAGAGHDLLIATPQGRPAPVDPASVSPGAVGAEPARDFSAYIAGLGDLLRHPARLEEQRAGDFDAIVMPGGHGPIVDLAQDPAFGALLRDADQRGVIIAPFCHGPAGLLAAKRPDGSFQFAGRRLTAFTDREERAGGLGDAMPWFLASRLAERGAIVEGGEPFTSHVVVDRNLITGQNPQSSAAIAREVRKALGR